MPGQPTLTNNTKVTLATAVTVLFFIIGSTITGIREWDSTRAQIAQLQRDQWTVRDQLQWTSETQKRNPGLDIPIPAVHDDGPSPAMSIIYGQGQLAGLATNFPTYP